jgi:hypothetical protein
VDGRGSMRMRSEKSAKERRVLIHNINKDTYYKQILSVDLSLYKIPAGHSRLAGVYPYFSAKIACHASLRVVFHLFFIVNHSFCKAPSC